MDCKEKLRLIDEYFDAFKRQQWIRVRLESIRADGIPQLLTVAETQADTATDECYDAWCAMNAHECSDQCDY